MHVLRIPTLFNINIINVYFSIYFKYMYNYEIYVTFSVFTDFTWIQQQYGREQIHQQ